MKLLPEMKRSLYILPPKDRKKLLIVSGLQSALGILDLVGVVLLGALGSLAIRGVQSKGPGDRVSRFLDLVGIDQVSFQGQVAILGIVAALFLAIKTLLSVSISRKILQFLGRKSAEISDQMISKSLSRNLIAQQNLTPQMMQYAIGTGVSSLVIGFIGTSTLILSDAVLLLIMALGIFYIDPVTAALAISLFGAIGTVLYFSMHRRARKIGLELAKFNLESSEKLNEVLLAYREIYVRNSRFFYASKISKLRHQYSSFNAEQALLPNISKYIVELSITIGVLLISAVLFLTRDASQAASGLLAFMAAGSRIAPAILRLQQSLIQLQVNAGSANPTIELIRELETVSNLEEPIGKLIGNYPGFESKVIIKEMNFCYEDQSKFAIKEFNLEIHEGEFVAFVGPSGSGKSTLVDLILGLNEPTSGSIEISNLSPDIALQTWPGVIGYVPQDVGIINGTIRENLGIGFDPGQISDDDFLYAIDQSGLRGFIDESSLGLNILVGERGTKLSGGQKQRLGIARALVTKPRLLIFDEATSSLDGQSESAISNAIRDLKGSVTLIMIAHRLSTVRFADKVVYIENGTCIKVGKFEEVISEVPNFGEQAKLMGL